jgi:hypothetical protein
VTLQLNCGQIPATEWLRSIGSQPDTESTIVMLRASWCINDMTAENIAKTIFPMVCSEDQKWLLVTMPDGWHWKVEDESE